MTHLEECDLLHETGAGVDHRQEQGKLQGQESILQGIAARNLHAELRAQVSGLRGWRGVKERRRRIECLGVSMATKSGYDGGATGALTECDLIGLGSVLRICELDIVPLDGHGPSAEARVRVHDRALFCTGVTRFGFRGRFELPEGWSLLGFLHTAPGARNWCHGAPLEGGTAIAALSDGAADFALDAGATLSLLLVPIARLQACHGRSSLSSASVPPGLFGPFVAHGYWGDQLRERHEHVRQALRLDASLDDDEVERLLEAHVQAAMSVDPLDRPVCPRGQRAHYVALQRAEQYMRENMQHDIYMDDICEAIGVGERTLRHAFKSLLGISPNRYLSMLRLCMACRSLSVAGAEDRSVKSVALSCGLWDLSRFAENYRRVFGELPSDTLHRRHGHSSVHGTIVSSPGKESHAARG